ncbi:MAG TPA: pitrilysin family protein [Anaeromyxobacteraceae bacterium]|nr:pitrilysin family protein [Anaeromyxobacteraceae bacterium]
MGRILAACCLLALACSAARPPPAELGPTSEPGAVPVVREEVAPGDRSKVPEPGPAPVLKVPPQRHFQLASGLKVRLVEYRRLPIVALHLVVDAGAVHDPKDRPGLASFTASMMTEGTKRRSATQISDDLGFIGASLSAGAGFDSASLSGSALVAHLDELLDLFDDVLEHPSFPPGDFARVQDQRLVSLLQQRDQPGAVAAKTFARQFWGEHPYGHWIQGTEKSVKAMKRADLVRYHAARWRPNVSELVVVGDVSEAELRQKLEKALAGWTGVAPASPPPHVAPVPKLRAVLVRKRGAAPQTFVMMGMPGLERASPDYVPGEVASQILGGGTASRLFRELREKEGYTYGIYSRVEARKLGGTSFIVGSVKAEVTGVATQALLRQVDGLRTTAVPDEELAVAKNSLLLSLPSEFAIAAGIAGKVAEEVVYGLPDDYWDGYASQVAGVTAADVQRAARKYFDPARLTTVMVGDPGTVKAQLSKLPLGAVEVRTAASAP